MGKDGSPVMFMKVLYLAFPLVVGGFLQSLVLRFALFPGLVVPLDLGGKFRGKRVFGDNKTLRGLLVMVLGAVVGMAAQSIVYSFGLFRRISLFDYAQVNPVWAGTALGLGFILGELPNSFLKRQCGIAPGGQGMGSLFWLFSLLDQIDSVVGCLIAAALTFWVPDWNIVVWTLAAGILLHMAVNGFFVLVHVKERIL